MSRVNRVLGNHTIAPFIINIELTDYCPLKCIQCYKDNKAFKNMDYEYFKELVKEAAEIGTRKILLSGGEPFTYPHIIEAIELIKKRNIYVVVSTSGYGVDAKIVEKLKESGLDMLFISLNGSNKQINDLSRDGYQLATKAMRLCKEMKLPYRINWVARHDNVHDLPDLIKLCKTEGAVGIDILINKPNPSGYIDSPMSFEDLEYLYGVYQQNTDFLMYQTCFYLLRNMQGVNANLLSGCAAGTLSMAIFSDHTFSVCPHIKGNQTYKSIMEFWENDKTTEFRTQKTIKKDTCHSCANKKICMPCMVIYNTHNACIGNQVNINESIEV